MKKFLVFLCAMFVCVVAFAHTINWRVGDQIISTTTCDSGDSITPPTAPAKYGYHFKKWQLPYIELSYIEFSGEQYIRTTLNVPEGYTHAKVGVVPISDPENEVLINYPGGTLGRSYERFYLWSRTASSALSSNTVYAGTFYDIDYIVTPNRRTLTVNNSSVSDNVSTALPEGAVTVSGSSLCFYGKIYYYKEFDSNNNLIINLIPTKRTFDNAIGMYDTVTKKFFTNSGTGEIIAGPEVGYLQ